MFSKNKTLRQIGEFGFIRQIRRGAPTRRDVVVGIGDDAAVLLSKGPDLLLFKTDMLLEGVHFRLSEASCYEVGYKAMAVNVSDIAAMGGVPTHAVAAVGINPAMTLRQARGIYRGLKSAAVRFGIGLVGGDTNRSDKLVVSVALLGRVSRKHLVLRSTAKPGDVIMVSGRLGGSYVTKKHLRFIPRLEESQYLVRNFKIHSMMDLSDGLSSDLFRLCQESRVGCLIRAAQIPVVPQAGSLEHALCDGEDFELLFTLSVKEAARLLKRSKNKHFTFYPVGLIWKRSNGLKIIGRDGRYLNLREEGFNHFRQ